MQWYYAKNGSQLGPVEQGELLGKISSGEIAQTDMVWREGMGDWLPVSKVNELVMVARPVPTPSAPAPSALGESPYSPPQSQPVAPSPQPYQGPAIATNLWQSIVVTLFCCLPFGIVAIVYAAKVDGFKARGDFAGASSAAASSRMWCNISILVWVGLVVLSVVGNMMSRGSH